MTNAAAVRAFIEHWERVELNEKAVAQSHFNALCRLLGLLNPVEADPKGEFYRFEKPLTKVGGSAGYADVWRKDRFAWEYKTKGRYPDLRAAYQQLLLYKEDLDNPPVLVACDIANYEAHIAFTGYKTRVERFTNADLANASTRELLRLIFTDPQQLRPTERQETITEQAASRFAQVAQFLERRGFTPAQVAPFFMRVLFALFAEDIRLLPAELMTNSLRQSIFSPAEFPERARALFRAMREGGYFGMDRVPRFNGWLFADDEVLPLSADELQFLADAARLDWASVEPAIFGTLFERSLDPSKRSQLGAHYTSRDDILLIVEPVLMAPLRREWATVREGVEALRTQWDAQTGNARRKLQSVAEGMILDFMERLAGVRVLDPACGSGNFLYVALNQLKDLEKEVWAYAGGVGLPQPELSVSPRQLHGIEKNQFAAELAQVVVWIGFLQWQRANGFFAIHEPILQALHTIECRDAILTVDLHGNPAEPPWPAADVIIGNPPFLGDKKMRGELGDVYVENLRKLYEGRVPGGADLVTYWFERARQYIVDGKVQRAGLLATQGIRGIANRKVLERIKQTGDIFMAWSDRPWILDGAAVRVSMVGFDGSHADAAASVQSGGPHADVAPSVETPRRGVSTTTMNDAPIADPAASVGARHASPVQPMLNGIPVAAINADLTGNINLTSAARLSENENICFLGMMKAGPFDLTAEQAGIMLSAPLNINGRPNADVVKRRLGGQDVVGRPRDIWIIDFGVDTTEEQAAQYKLPYEYVRQHVKPFRDNNRRDSMRIRWWIHGEPRRGLRNAIHERHLQRCIVTPEVSKHRIFIWMDTSIIPDHKLHVFVRDDDYFFGVLHSRVHEVWTLAQCSWLGVGNDPSYSSSRTFATFPFPWPPGHEPHSDPRIAAIAEAARDLVQQRDAWLAGEDDPHPGAARHPAPTGKGAGGEGEQSGVRETPEAPSSIILRPSSTRDRTLTNLYNQRPDWLTDAHRRLDRAVFAAYGWPDDLSDEAILERLLALNLERAARQGGSE